MNDNIADNGDLDKIELDNESKDMSSRYCNLNEKKQESSNLSLERGTIEGSPFKSSEYASFNNQINNSNNRINLFNFQVKSKNSSKCKQ